ncbi:hypothetical protein [Psychroflexus sp. ALD_RP9]|uniref:hypothetical protein n=1 Tax=Psychroflexus sp. ALD_RP9 TaxID=2777186 RepID=UPI001A8FA7D7|nr:hypothetical protein [Psychroflexus sp. ALD_RP9]QSS96665.1 hypothetical protein IMZ30_09450 [Psychroflexus sp. ALD_RP9]
MKIILTIIILIGINSNAQELTCADFKEGRFYIPETETESENTTEIENDDNDAEIEKYIVIRKGNTQTEWTNGIGNGKPDYEIIEWIDDCTYRLTYDDSKYELDAEKKWVNDNNGIVVSKTKIVDNCLMYEAILTTNDGQKISQNGIICRE